MVDGYGLMTTRFDWLEISSHLRRAFGSFLLLDDQLLEHNSYDDFSCWTLVWWLYMIIRSCSHQWFNLVLRKKNHGSFVRPKAQAEFPELTQQVVDHEVGQAYPKMDCALVTTCYNICFWKRKIGCPQIQWFKASFRGLEFAKCIGGYSKTR